ncbi:hypothetical protein EDD85DRAFT_433692 [Armillaria nabsnona]|nr:hypothetical protein EDD85DRAFT_433692 [Armillaria nabsnona]
MSTEYSVEDESSKTVSFLNRISSATPMIFRIPYLSLHPSQNEPGHSITTNRGVADQMDHDYSTWFLALCRGVLASQRRLLAEREQVDVFEDAKKIVDCAVDGVWNRFFLKVFTLRKYFLAVGVRASGEPSPGFIGLAYGHEQGCQEIHWHHHLRSPPYRRR